MNDLFNRNHLAAMELLESWGIDPHDVVNDSMTTEGYLVFQRNAITGRFLIESGELLVKERAWPEGFPVDVFFGFVHAWRGAVG